MTDISALILTYQKRYASQRREAQVRSEPRDVPKGRLIVRSHEHEHTGAIAPYGWQFGPNAIAFAKTHCVHRVCYMLPCTKCGRKKK